MNPILYEETETKFITNGLGLLSDAISCSVTEERNGEYELEMTYPISGIHYSKIQLNRIISAIPADGKKRQPFDIYKISKPLDGVVTINARHISYRISGIVTKPATATSCAQALQTLKDHAVTNCPFEFWTDKETVANYRSNIPASIRSRLGGVEGSILDIYGGEYEWDNFTVKLYNHRGNDSGVVISYGKNLTDIKQEESIENTVVGIYPYWHKDATESESEQLIVLDSPVYSEYADNFTNKMVAVLDCSSDFENAPTKDQLKTFTESYIKNNNIGIPSVNLDVSFVALWQTEEYKNIAPLERVNLCDTVTIEYPKLKVSATAKVIKTVYNVLLERYTSITLGDAKSSLTSTIISGTDNTNKRIDRSRTFLERAIEHATDLISGGLGGHVVISVGENGKPNEILIMDTDDVSTAVNVIRMNVNGIGFSKTGYNGPFTTAWTIDGVFNADFINAGTLTATIIKAGILASIDDNKNFWLNIQDGSFRLGAIKSIGTNNQDLLISRILNVEYGVELWRQNENAEPYIDFHSEADSPSSTTKYDYAARISCAKSGTLQMLGVDKGDGNGHYHARLEVGGLELYQSKSSANATTAGIPYIDFHLLDTEADYTMRIAAETTDSCVIRSEGGYGAIINIKAATLTAASSRRIKTNIANISEADADKLLKLRPVSFEYTYAPGETYHGLIAEEVQEVLPELVTVPKSYDPDSTDTDPLKILRLSYTDFVPYLIKLCQTQQSEIDDLKTRVAKLEEAITKA